MPQSRASAVVARVLAPQAGERVLDLCAAPGGKTTHLAALMGGEGELVAVEVHPGRARALAETCRQMGADNVRVAQVDAREFSDAQPFDRVLVDPPCSGLGTLQARPDLRWQPRRGRSPSSRHGRPSCCAPVRAAEAGRHAGVLGLHDQPSGGGRGGGSTLPGGATRTSPASSAGSCCPATDGTDGFFIAGCYGVPVRQPVTVGNVDEVRAITWAGVPELP